MKHIVKPHFKKLSFLLISLFMLGSIVNAKGLTQQMKLLVIIDDSQPLKVNFISVGDNVSKNLSIGLGGFLTTPVIKATIESRNKKYSATLQETVGVYPGRVAYIKKMLETGFYQETDKIDITFLNLEEANKYFSEGKPQYAALQNDQWYHMLVVKETAGFTTPNGNHGKLSTSSSLEVLVYDTQKKKRIFKQNFLSLYSDLYERDAAITTKELFTTTYPHVHILGSQIYFRLNGQDILAQIAQKYGMESEFPSVSTVLKKYSKQFSFDMHKPKSWETFKSESDYIFRSGPKKDKAVMGIVTDIDLLIKPLGQNGLSLPEFVDLRISRLRNVSLNPQPMDEALQILDLDESWASYMFANTNGGISIMLHKIQGKEYSVNHQIILLGNNYLELLKKYKEDIEDYVNKSELSHK